MAFLTKTDFETYIKEPALNQVTSFNDTLLTEAQLSAQAEMESYLRIRYDVANIFNKTGAQRNPIVVTYLIDLTLYHLFSRIDGRRIPELRIDRYNNAIMWLDKVAEGKLTPDLPALTVDGETVQTNFRMGNSQDKLTNVW